MLAMVSLVSLSSCAFFQKAINKMGLGGGTASETSSVIPSSEKSSKKEASSKPQISSELSKPKTSAEESSSIAPTSTITNVSTSSTAAEENLDYGYNSLSDFTIGDKYQELYLLFKDVLVDGANSTSDYNGVISDGGKLVDSPYPRGQETYTVGEDVYRIYYSIGDVEITSFNIPKEEVFSVYKCVLLDNPQFYFVSSTVLYFTIGTRQYVKILIDPEYIDYDARLLYNAKISGFVSTYESGITSSMTTLEKVKYTHDYITSNAEYAYEADGVTPSSSVSAHNIIGIIDEKKGVCESYAKLFTYLLKNIGIQALTVGGKGFTSTSGPEGEAHAWNYVKIAGEYYSFDVTWDDSTDSYDYYGMSYNSNYFGRYSGNGRHAEYVTTIKTGIEYYYPLPSLSLTDIIVA